MSRARFAARLVDQPGSVLDIGCRDGELSQYVSGPYAGADLIPGPHVRYAGDIASIKIGERFDTVFALDILEHLEHPSAMFDRLVGLARKQVVISLPNCYGLKNRWRFLRGGPLNGKYLFLEHEPLDRHRWLMNRDEIYAWMHVKAAKHGLQLSIHDMRYGSSGLLTLVSRMGRMTTRLLPPNLTTETVFGVFCRVHPEGCEHRSRNALPEVVIVGVPCRTPAISHKVNLGAEFRRRASPNPGRERTSSALALHPSQLPRAGQSDRNYGWNPTPGSPLWAAPLGTAAADARIQLDQSSPVIASSCRTWPRPARTAAAAGSKSSDKGLSADFTSLQAQREICSAYIASQQHKGWIELPKRYEDAGLSGATLARPAIQELLADVERGQVDIVVVYKLDRLSRSLLDFVRLLESFERCGASFVCITQNFDTADSLGRLVMNVLLTFAQFERELAGDRIRDKKRLMTARGLWSGGRAPLGYDLVAHRLIVNENEAALVRHLYERYVALRSMKAVTRECRLAGLVSKKRVEKDGRVNGGCLLSIGSVRSILRNPIYVGELKSEKGTSRGLHTAIISADLWHRVREIREAQTRQRVTSAPEDLFGGLTFDCYGRRMKPDRRYLKCGWVALYTSFQTEWARAQGLKRLRLNASSFENVVLSGFHDLLHDRPRLRSIMIELGNSLLAPAARGASISRRLRTLEHAQLRRCLHALVERIEVSRERILVQLRSDEVMRLLDWDGIGSFSRGTVGGRSKLFCLSMPCVGVARLERRLRLPIRTNTVEGSPDRRLVALIREAREAQLLADTYRGETADQLAGRLHRCTGYFMRLLRLNYLAPDIVAAVLDGNQPVTLRRKQLLNSDLPLDWTIQRQLFGFPEQPPLQTSERY